MGALTGPPDPRKPADQEMSAPPKPAPPKPVSPSSLTTSSKIIIEVVTPGALLRVAGRLDARSAPTTRSVLHEAVDGGDGELVIEMNKLEIWDGTGLGVIVGTSRRARQSGRQLVLTGVQARELRLLRVARVTWTSSVRPAALVG